MTDVRMTVKCTDSEREHAKMLADKTGESVAKMILRLLSEEGERYGMEPPDDVSAPHGGYREREIRRTMAIADRLTDYGRNDPTEV